MKHRNPPRLQLPKGIHDSPVAAIFDNHQLLATAMALGSLGPDEDEWVWRTRRLAPMALHAQLNPDSEAALRWLARHWSSGALRGRRARAWTTPDARTGRSRAWTFADEWPRMLTSRFGPDALDIDVIRQDADALEQCLDDRLPTLHFGETAVGAEAAADPLRLLLH